MSSRQMIEALLLIAGLCILVLLMLPVVHVPCIVVHGPTTAMRAQRAAWLLVFLLEAGAFLFTGLLPRPIMRCTGIVDPVREHESADLNLDCALRC
jgi:hypothetical protein